MERSLLGENLDFSLRPKLSRSTKKSIISTELLPLNVIIMRTEEATQI